MIIRIEIADDEQDIHDSQEDFNNIEDAIEYLKSKQQD